jgi:hypothetical protein
MQPCYVSRHAVGLCFYLTLLNFSGPSVCSFKLKLTAKSFLGILRYFMGIAGNTMANLQYGPDIGSSILNGRACNPEGVQALLDFGHLAQPSAAELAPLTSHLAAFGVKR